MSCCGRVPLAPLPRAAGAAPRAGAAGVPPPSAPVAPAVPFTYVGATRLVAEGPVTRRRYRFEHPGAVVDVDARDAPSFAAIAPLRRGGSPRAAATPALREPGEPV